MSLIKIDGEQVVLSPPTHPVKPGMLVAEAVLKTELEGSPASSTKGTTTHVLLHSSPTYPWGSRTQELPWKLQKTQQATAPGSFACLSTTEKALHTSDFAWDFSNLGR